MRRFGPRAAAALTCAAVAVAGGVIVLQSRQALRAERRGAASAVANATARGIEGQLANALAAIHGVSALVRAGETVSEIDALALDLLRLHEGLGTVQLQPDGVVRHIVPLAGNEPAIGMDVLHDPRRRRRALDALESRSPTLDGPYTLVQGGTGLVVRLPVFRGGEAGGDRFWGFVAVTMKLDALLRAAHVGALDAGGYSWSLAGADAPAAFASSASPPADPVRAEVTVPNGRWRLDVAPRSGWTRPSALALQLALTLAIAAAAGALAHRIAREPEALRREVAARTSALDDANRRLREELAERLRAEAARREAEEHARQAQKLEAIGQLAGGVAHDFNNLLVGILGYADLLEEPDAPVAEAASGIRAAAQRAAALTKQLLGFARRGKYVSTVVDANAVVREVAELLRRTVEQSIAIELRLAGTAATVMGDPGQLHQVVLNLAVNARDAMPDGGTLTLETRVEELAPATGQAAPVELHGTCVAIRVTDTGTGIPEAIRGRVFEPFFTTKEPGRGTGMGLAMVYGIVRNHGGAVRFSTELSRGTQFTAYLPFRAGEARGEPAPPARPSQSGRVLLVDDEAIVRSAVSRMLTSLGYEVTALSSGAEALDHVRRHPGEAEVALVDVMMPEMDGLACFASLRRIDPRLATVLCSGYGPDGRVQQALDAGAAGFLQKPYGIDAISREVARALKARRDASGGGAEPGA